MATRANVSKPQEEVDKLAMKRDALLSKTPQEIDAYIDAHVVSLETAKDFLKFMAKAIILLHK